MTQRPWFSSFWRFGASYWLHSVGPCDKPGAEYPLTQRRILHEKDASATQLLKICGPTLGPRVVWECSWEQELGRQGEYSRWSPWAGALVFLYFNSLLCLLFLYFLLHVFSNKFSGDLFHIFILPSVFSFYISCFMFSAISFLVIYSIYSSFPLFSLSVFLASCFQQ